MAFQDYPWSCRQTHDRRQLQRRREAVRRREDLFHGSH
uniref:Uncharacterized protein n=1 Tax=Brassica campestris TaxID=3711 RepID=A0A3P5ZW80_BRACM|nr:unnamed protein product [Brassica rapa]